MICAAPTEDLAKSSRVTSILYAVVRAKSSQFPIQSGGVAYRSADAHADASRPPHSRPRFFFWSLASNPFNHICFWRRDVWSSIPHFDNSLLLFVFFPSAVLIGATCTFPVAESYLYTHRPGCCLFSQLSFSHCRSSFLPRPGQAIQPALELKSYAPSNSPLFPPFRSSLEFLASSQLQPGDRPRQKQQWPMRESTPSVSRAMRQLS